MSASASWWHSPGNSGVDRQPHMAHDGCQSMVCCCCCCGVSSRARERRATLHRFPVPAQYFSSEEPSSPTQRPPKVRQTSQTSSLDTKRCRRKRPRAHLPHPHCHLPTLRNQSIPPARLLQSLAPGRSCSKECLHLGLADADGTIVPIGSAVCSVSCPCRRSLVG